LALDPAHEATFHARSYGFRRGRSAQDAQKILQINLRSFAHGIDKRVIELDIEKCFDRIAHKAILDRLIAPQTVKQGIFHCLKAGTTPEFPDQGTPQGGIVSPLLANIALNGIEAIHPSVRYADDMIFFLKPEDDAERVLDKIKTFLAERSMKISEKKTKVTATTSGFDFLGWNFKVQTNGTFKSRPSRGNYLAMRKKVKAIVNCSNIGAEDKSKKLAPIIRGWRNYHKYCAMDKARDSLWSINHRTWKVFNKEESLNRYQVDNLVKAAFPTISYSENRFVNVQGEKSPYDGDLTYWSKRNSKLYDGITAQTLKNQHHSCGHCGLKLTSEEKIHLHHIDSNHKNWKRTNLLAVHESCHDYIHMSKRERKGETSPN
jgi:group II intron reverse transcriptase/maturase